MVAPFLASSSGNPEIHPVSHLKPYTQSGVAALHTLTPAPDHQVLPDHVTNTPGYGHVGEASAVPTAQRSLQTHTSEESPIYFNPSAQMSRLSNLNEPMSESCLEVCFCKRFSYTMCAARC